MIAVFLRTELTSERFGDKIQQQLDKDGRSRALVESPDLGNEADNAYRRQLLASYRAYLFEELSPQLRWYWASLTPDEVAQIRYIDYSYWNELSRNTRLPAVAAETIRAGREVFGVSSAGFLKLEAALRRGAKLPPLIVVGAEPSAPLTVIEGHLRLTAYLLAPECLPAELEVLVGFTPECSQLRMSLP